MELAAAVPCFPRMRDDTTVSVHLLDPGVTQGELLRAVGETPPGRLVYHGPFHVRQMSTAGYGLEAVLRFEHRHTAALTEILSGMDDERVKLLFRLNLEPKSFIRVYTDAVYHPYQDYVRCIVALAPYLADVDFLLCLAHEDGAGEGTYLVDHYRIAKGELRWLRSQTPDEDLDAYLLAAHDGIGPR
ncbi:hypothetical protein OG462_42665 [Streptomyces sp. NBC_01077]|uniref:hypothetical protein n=1 Tax=Streptomyces sp. NBC_01077 TaxID=2903746 RepID=UPI00386BCCB0|nr:hypothetical protein OG462_02355 [Streptomyces sp. NBC_01077]WSV43537.1 hypothetical protein OG462_42665 [Streptomyces sp. NBC_01077]